MSESKQKKALKLYVVNGTVIDATGVTEAALQGYDQILLNAATVVTNRTAQDLLARCPVTMNAANQICLETEGPVQISCINGKSVIRPGQAVPKTPTYLCVNGKLEIEPGCEAILKQYVGFTVNGTILCPDSVLPLLASAQVNGSIRSYPDGCVLLPPTAALDTVFALRAKPATGYYAARLLYALDPAVDWAALAAKNIRLCTGTLLVCESLAERVLPLVDDRASVEILPDGCRYLDGRSAGVGADPDHPLVLDENLLRRWGNKLYVGGDLTVNGASAPALARLDYLRIRGTAWVTQGMMDAFAAADAACGSLVQAADRVITDRLQLTVDSALLEGAPGTLEIRDCVTVTIAPQVPTELLQTRLAALRDCVEVRCTPAQRAAVSAVSQDVVRLQTDEKKEADGRPDGKLGKVQKLLQGLGLDLTEIDVLGTLMGSKMVNGSLCRL